MPESPVHPRPTRLGRFGRYAGVVLVAAVAWLISLPARPDAMSDHVTAFVVVDLVVGLATIGLLPFRRRYPFAIALAASVVQAVFSAAAGTWLLAVVSLGTRRSVLRSTVVVVVSTGAELISEAVWDPVGRNPDPQTTAPWWFLALFGVLMNTLVTAVGFYIGARRDLLASLRERAETAEREQASRAAQARVAERSRIAREMHDVLAHRISTVAMHSGALAYRDDLTREQVRGAAHLIQENAHSALIELREILGVLREEPTRVIADETPTGSDAAAQGSAARAPEPPQPTITDLSRLVDDAVAAGQPARLDLRVADEDIPAALGRHVYRAVQECLTNARKHAAGSPVDIRIARSPERGGADLVVEVGNPLAAPVEGLDHDAGTLGNGLRQAALHIAAAEQAPSLPPSGVGLLGLAERAELAGGTLVHGPEGGRYVTRFTVPWPERSGS